jgi:hypothetical protein
LASLSQPDFAGTFGQFTPTSDVLQPGASAFAAPDTSPTASLPSEITTGASTPDAGFGAFQNPNLNMAERVGLTGYQPPSEVSIPASQALALQPPTEIPGGPTVGSTAQAAITSPPTAASDVAELQAAVPPTTSGITGAAPGGGGIGGAISSALASPWVRGAEVAAPLAFLGYNLARGPAPISPYMQQAVANTAGAQQLANTYYQAAANNQLTPQQWAAINTYKQNARNALYQQIAASGKDPNTSSDYIQGLQQIDQQALALQQQYITAMINNASTAMGQVDSTLQAAANMQVANDNAFNQAIGSSLSSFALAGALSSRTAA